MVARRVCVSECVCVCVCVCVCTEYERALMQRRLGVASGDRACIHAQRRNAQREGKCDGARKLEYKHERE